ncbi:hypothetical protein Prum_001980 [Phytohabitans rumicis]|uniref:DUF4132 domain-containing protein n=1 Tax=Phytohabitans rumicis TaxID=1076125 RepID=A0A6V8KXJ7_9ACTN|nr:hypothetical protein Prum_001980 [Phytohabitans rumicis]
MRWWSWLAGRPGRRGERAWGRLHPDELCQLARTPDHPLAARAQAAVAELWVRTRDPALRAVVVHTGAVAAADPDFRLPHLVTLALHRRLDEAPAQGVANGLPALLDDPDPDVVAAAEQFALTASGPALSTLWRARAPAPRVRELVLANPEPLPDDALGAAWSAWLSTPDRRLWDKMDGRPAATGAVGRLSRVVLGLATPAQTYAAVLSGASSDLVASHALRWCRDRGYAPDDPAARAALFVLTGQMDRYRVLDPDGALLARAYHRAPQRLRRRLRAAMTEVDGVNPVRVLTGSDLVRRTMTAAEREYLIRHLAGRRAWDPLWQLALALPLVHAVHAARVFNGWRPPHEPDRTLFERLTAVRPTDLTAQGLDRQAVPARLRPLFERPPHLLRAADLGRVEEALARSAPESATPATALLLARLTHRFAP